MIQIGWMSRPIVRQTFLGSLIIGILLIVSLSCCLLWPVWREYQDEQRADALLQELRKLKSDAESSGSFPNAPSPNAFDWTEGVKNSLSQISSPAALKRIYEACIEEAQRRGDFPDDPAVNGEFQFWTIILVFYRLGEINTDQSAQIFVELYCDENLHTDGGSAESVSEALEMCKTKALPYLRVKLESIDEVRREWFELKLGNIESSQKSVR